MLQEIRERAQGWVAWAIVILISVPFAFWGIDSYLGGGREPFVAKVDGTKISERAFTNNVQRTRMELRERLGAAFDPALFDDARIRAQVLEQMINELVLRDATLGLGLRVSDQAVQAAILAEPFFQEDGVFSRAAYQRVLRLQGLSPAGYEENLRQRLLTTQLPRAVTETEFVTPAELDASIRLLRQRRELSYILLDAASFMPTEAPDEESIQAWYDTHQAAFETPEQVRASYLLLDAATLLGDAAPDEATLRERYQERLPEFSTPEERRIRHILITAPVGSEAEVADAARERLLAAREQILAGADFATLAAELSDDPGSAANGGDLGFVARGLLDPAFAEVAFGLPAGELSEPVRSRFGYHLIEVTEVRGGEVSDFEAVREQLARELTAGQTEAAFFDAAEQLATLAYESPDSLIPAAEALGLTVQTSDWFARDGGEGLFANPRVVAAAFSDDVLEQGNNSELIEPALDGQQALVLRVDDRRPPALQPMEAVRDEIIASLQSEQAAAAALEAAAAMVEQLQAGAPLDEVAGEHAVVVPGLVARNAPGLLPTVLQVGFALPRPESAAADSTYGSAATPEGGAVVVALASVDDADPTGLPAAERAGERSLLSDALGRSHLSEFLAYLRGRAKVEQRAFDGDELP
ncbi:MAG: peptidylprolyl isomerase [Chromatiaceae bacterium]|nr:MAG: peptidylprolyl isomerase [Chromatiaceae bacterium]